MNATQMLELIKEEEERLYARLEEVEKAYENSLNHANESTIRYGERVLKELTGEWGAVYRLYKKVRKAHESDAGVSK